MSRRAFLALILVNLAGVLVLLFTHPHLMVSPGKLMDAHLELTTDCFACHTPFRGSPPKKCIVCHKVNDIGLRTTKGVAIGGEKKNVAFHQKLIEEDCVACHSDHKGVKAFRPIGQFFHGLLDPVVEKQCDGCHQQPGDALHQRIRGNCGECHSQQAWKPATLDHDPYFRFDRDHTTECATCHVESNYGSYTCYGCHEHSRSKIREEHLEEGIQDYENCVECHRSGDKDEAEQIWKSRGLRAEGGMPGLEGREGHEKERKHKRKDHD